MIKINIAKSDDQIDKIIIKGHSGYDVSGKDIVCSSVSSIVITSINAIIRFDNNAISYNEDEGYVEVKINNHTKEVDILIDNMVSLLKELEKQYKKNIEINE